MKYRILRVTLSGLLLWLMTWAAWSQVPYPSRPVKMVIPFAPGGAVDAMGRLLAEYLSPLLGQPVVVDNRSGAGGQLGVEAIAKAAPDGISILFTSNGPLVVLPLLEPTNVKYNTAKDLTPVSRVGTVPVAIVVPSSLGISDFNGLRELLLSQPGKHAYGSSGIGTIGHLSVSYLAQLIGANLIHVPYKSTGAARLDLLAGRLTLMVESVHAVDEQARAGRVVAIAVLAKNRVPGFGMPTIAEAGLPAMLKYDWSTWTMVLVPRATPQAIAARLNSAIVSALRDPALEKRFYTLGVSATPTSLDDSQSFLNEQIEGMPSLFTSMGLLRR